MHNSYTLLIYILVYYKMIDQLVDEESIKSTYKIYLCFTLAILVIMAPVNSIIKAFEYQDVYQAYLYKLVIGPKDESAELPLSELFPVLQRNPFRGKWQSSIKRSSFLTEEQGLIEIKSLKQQSNDSYKLFLRIFDGIYRQNKFYDIQIESSSLIIKQRFQPGKIIYDAVSPLICFYRNGTVFHFSPQQSIYLNKIKIKVKALFQKNVLNIEPQGMELELLISSQYSINLIAWNIKEYEQTFHDLLFAIFLVVLVFIQMKGLYNIYNNIYTQREYRERFSKTGLLAATALDFTLAIILSMMCSLNQKKFAVYSLPAFMLWFMIIFMEFRVLMHLNNYQSPQNTCKFNIQVYFVLGIVCSFTYLCNLRSIFFIISTVAVIFPQVWRNYTVGHKLKNNVKNYFMFALPRYAIIIYLRMYKYNAFDLKTKLFNSTICLLIILFQVLLILAQMKYGVRAILPKFVHPSEFQYFMSQKQEDQSTCSICLLTLKEKSPELGQTTSLQSEDLYNMIVQTPCRHKFHIECLARWMQTRLQCPNCRRILPPIEEYQ